MKPVIYFAIPRSHSFTAKLVEMDKQCLKAKKAWNAFQGQFGLPANVLQVFNGERLLGFTTNPSQAMNEWVEAHPAWMWVRVRRGVDYARPRATGSGKGHCAALRALPTKGGFGDLEKAFGIHDFFIDGMAIVCLSLYRPKGKLPLLGVPWVMFKKYRKCFDGMKEMGTKEVAEIMDKCDK